MTKNTQTTLAAILAAAANGTIDQTRLDAALAVMEGRAEAVAAKPNRDELGRVVRTPEAQKILGGVTSKTLRVWAARGRLVPVYGAGARRIGYTADSVRAILAGRSVGIARGPAVVG